eukprot:364282-Chlamydomonas_euryale.AAC.41
MLSCIFVAAACSARSASCPRLCRCLRLDVSATYMHTCCSACACTLVSSAFARFSQTRMAFARSAIGTSSKGVEDIKSLLLLPPTADGAVGQAVWAGTTRAVRPHRGDDNVTLWVVQLNLCASAEARFERVAVAHVASAVRLDNVRGADHAVAAVALDCVEAV